MTGVTQNLAAFGTAIRLGGARHGQKGKRDQGQSKLHTVLHSQTFCIGDPQVGAGDPSGARMLAEMTTEENYAYPVSSPLDGQDFRRTAMWFTLCAKAAIASMVLCCATQTSAADRTVTVTGQ